MKGKLKKVLSILTAVLMLAMSLTMTAAAADTNFTLRLEGRAEGAQAEEINAILSQSFIELAGSGNSTGGVLNLTVQMAGQRLLRLLAEATDTKLAISLPDVDGNRYEMSGEKILEWFGSLATTQDGSLLSESMPALLAGPGISDGELEAAIMPYLNIISEHIGSTLQTNEEAVIELKRLGQSVPGMTAVYEPDTRQLADLFGQLADAMEGDENLTGVVNKLAEYIRSLGSLVTDSSFYINYIGSTEAEPYGDQGEALPDDRSQADIAADNLIGFFQDLPGVLRVSSENLAQEEAGPVGLTFTLGMTGGEETSPAPALIDLTIAPEGEDAVSVGLETMAREEGRDICLYAAQGDESYNIRVSAMGHGQTRSGYVALEASGSSVLTAVYNWDLSRHSLIGVPYGNCVVTMPPLSVTLMVMDAAAGASAHKLMITGVEEATDGDLTGAALTLTTSDTASVEAPAGTVTELDNYTMDELWNLGMEILEKLSQGLEFM